MSNTELQERLNKLEKELAMQREITRILVSNAVNMQENAEMAERAKGGSGISFARAGMGLKSTQSYGRGGIVGALGIANIHNHANHYNTLGIGEFSAVLNGVRFGTRHNDFVLREEDPDDPTTTRNIAYPEVPPEVLNAGNIDAQIEEMKEWFKAWQTQNKEHRDYTKYFKPVLLVLEGWWQKIPDDDSLDEPFFSDRHEFDVSTFDQLHRTNRYLFASGGKWITENIGWLPSALVDADNQSYPVRGQWMYKLKAKLLNRDIPLSMFRAADDIASRLSNPGMEATGIDKKSEEQYLESRAARFEIADKWPGLLRRPGSNRTFPNSVDPWRNGTADVWRPLDELMYEMPGLDGDKAELEEISLLNGTIRTKPNEEKLNAARYSRAYGTPVDATGRKRSPRGINDPNLFVAMNTSNKVISRYAEYTPKNKRDDDTTRKLWGKWSYAVPLEIVWLTPLNSWNPHKIKFFTVEEMRETKIGPKSGGRNGSLSDDKAYLGNADWTYATTPAKFFCEENAQEMDPADTARGTVGVLGADKKAHPVIHSGIHVVLPKIDGVKSFQGTDRIRIRYPIAPVHEYNSLEFQEIKALIDMTHGSGTIRVAPDTPWRYDTRIRAPLWMDNPLTRGITFKVVPNFNHTHTVHIYPTDIARLLREEKVKLNSSRDSNHRHEFTLQLNVATRLIEIVEQKRLGNKIGKHTHQFPNDLPML